MKPIHKFNNGNGATLCNACHVIIETGLTDALLCDECNITYNRLMIESTKEVLQAVKEIAEERIANILKQVDEDYKNYNKSEMSLYKKVRERYHSKSDMFINKATCADLEEFIIEHTNQRVIEELEELLRRAEGSGRNITNVELSLVIKELKQE